MHERPHARTTTSTDARPATQTTEVDACRCRRSPVWMQDAGGEQHDQHDRAGRSSALRWVRVSTTTCSPSFSSFCEMATRSIMSLIGAAARARRRRRRRRDRRRRGAGHDQPARRRRCRRPDRSSDARRRAGRTRTSRPSGRRRRRRTPRAARRPSRRATPPPGSSPAQRAGPPPAGRCGPTPAPGSIASEVAVGTGSSLGVRETLSPTPTTAAGPVGGVDPLDQDPGAPCRSSTSTSLGHFSADVGTPAARSAVRTA